MWAEKLSGVNKKNWPQSKKRNVMKRITIGLIVCVAALQLSAAEAEWLTDLPKAQAKAKAENKIVLMEFTGSDWCPPCMKMHNEVFTTPEFIAYAKANLVLVEVDFPRKKKQSAELKKANEALEKKYDVEGYPTVIVLDKEGKKASELVGYQPGGPKAFVATLEKIKKKA